MVFIPGKAVFIRCMLFILMEIVDCSVITTKKKKQVEIETIAKMIDESYTSTSLEI